MNHTVAAMMLPGCNQNKNMNTLNLTQEWDNTFPKSELVKHSKVTFTNLLGITLAADLHVPKDAEGKLPAIAVCGPLGAVKEQSSGNSTDGWAIDGMMPMMNSRLLRYAGEIRSAVPIIPGAAHVDLSDDVKGVIPYDKMKAFFKENLK